MLNYGYLESVESICQTDDYVTHENHWINMYNHAMTRAIIYML